MNEREKSALSLADWPVAILAGGLATRLRPATEKIPKALLSVAGEPFVLHQLRLLRSAGFHRIVFCVGYLGEQIEALLGNGEEFGMQLSYAFDGATLRGTGGALAHAGAKLGREFIVLYGDSYLPIAYRPLVAAFLDSGQPALMAVFRNEGRWDTSNVSFEDGRVRGYSKRVQSADMRYIDYGVAVVRREIFEPFAERENFDLAEVYERLAAEGELGGFEVKERFYEIGSQEGLQELDALLRKPSLEVAP